MKDDHHHYNWFPEENCPHCDVIGIFTAYGAMDWDPQDIIEQVFRGLVTIVATAPGDLRKSMTLNISEHIGDYVEKVRADMVGHNIRHRMH